ncbi:MAG: DUF2264 domain-containing protein [Planctomycetes bacterium]|nr:DUF2264 domain-containing protein [Planctomycetota bacterium]
MHPAPDFKGYCRNYFARICRGYDLALDDTRVRAWLYGHKNPSDAGGAWDMSTRMFAALAAWLSDPARPRAFTLRGRNVDIEQLARSILINAFDPKKPGWWGREEFSRREQRTVESSMLAYGAWLLRDTLLPKIPARAISCFKEWLEYFGSGELVRGNWNLFWIVNHTARKALGWPHDATTVAAAWTRIEALHRGGGWMTDGPEQAFDDYNWWVFGTHEIFWMQMDGASDPARVGRMRERIQARMRDYPYFFGADGSYTEYGRSLAYKFARLGCPILAYKHGLWPHPPGMLKRLVRRHLAFYDNVGALDRATDTVRQALSEFGHPGVRDGYINTGHPYWCMHAFSALWQLGENDPLWSVDEEPLPVERGDFKRVMVPAGWILCGTQKGGHVHRHSLGSHNGGAKYGKFAYGSHFPVNFGTAESDYGPDAALCITDGQHWAHSGHYGPFAATEEYLRAKYELDVGGAKVSCETILVPEGEGCLRIHRLKFAGKANTKQGTFEVVEGGAPNGYAPGHYVTKRVDERAPYSLIASAGRTSLIYGLKGYTSAQRPQGFRGNEHLNGVHDRALTPAISVEGIRGKKDLLLVCWTLATLGETPNPPPKPKVKVTWPKSGAVEIVWERRKLRVPPLKQG